MYSVIEVYPYVYSVIDKSFSYECFPLLWVRKIFPHLLSSV